MSLYGRFFKPSEKTHVRRVLDRTDVMTPVECRAYIMSDWNAMKELYKKQGKSGLVYDKEANKRFAEEHQPYIDYIDEVISRQGKSTEQDIQCQRDMQCIRDIIASDILDAYSPDGYGSTNYDDIKVMDILLDDTSRNITMWPSMKWASTWNPKTSEYQKLYDKYVELHWKLDEHADDYDPDLSIEQFENKQLFNSERRFKRAHLTK